MSRYTNLSPFPERINRLDELAIDLWWSWQSDARAVFRRLDYTLWRATAHNPVRMLWVITAPEARGGRAGQRIPAEIRPRDCRARRGPARQGHLVGGAVSALRAPLDRVLLGRVRPAPVVADLRRRAGRPRRGPLQGGERPGRAVDWRRVHVPAGLLSPAHLRRGMAGGKLRAAQLGGCSDRAGGDTGRQAVHHRRPARRPDGARRGLARPARARQALPARHGSGGERAVGPRALGAPLRRRPRNTNPAGDHPGDRRRARAEDAGLGSGGVSPERGPRRVRRAATDPRCHRTGLHVRSGAGRDPCDDRVHHPHAGGGRTRRVPLPPRRKASGGLLGHARSEPRSISGARLLRQRRRTAIQHDRAGAAIGGTRQRGQPPARRRDPEDVGTDLARRGRPRAAGGSA